MSSSLAYRSELATLLPALDPEISAHITDDLLAAVRKPADSTGADDPLGREAMLISEVDAFHPRDLEETVLVVQVLSLHHSSMACFRAAAQCEVTSKEASRLRRDGIALQRSLAAMLRALHKSQARPICDDDLVPRPTVPVSVPRRTAKAAARPKQADPPPLPAHGGQTTEPDAESGTVPAASDPPAAAAPKRRINPFEGHPDLQRLNDRWNDLPPWEQMTMEERREAFGYKYTPKDSANPAAT